jgi:hypothetical protein
MEKMSIGSIVNTLFKHSAWGAILLMNVGQALKSFLNITAVYEVT